VGVRFARKYMEISRELSDALQAIDNVYEFAHMSADCWIALNDEERRECVETLSDDVFYALGAVPVLKVGRGWVRYNPERRVITVTDGAGCTRIVNLT
jgi:hypothetical protein